MLENSRLTSLKTFFICKICGALGNIFSLSIKWNDIVFHYFGMIFSILLTCKYSIKNLIYVRTKIELENMIKKIQKIGNSRGIVLDSVLLKMLGIEKDGFVDMELVKNKLIIRKSNNA